MAVGAGCGHGLRVVVDDGGDDGRRYPTVLLGLRVVVGDKVGFPKTTGRALLSVEPLKRDSKHRSGSI